MESCADGDVVLDTAPLLCLLRRLSPARSGSPPGRALSTGAWADCLPLLQTALCSGEPAVAAAAGHVYRAALERGERGGSERGERG